MTVIGRFEVIPVGNGRMSRAIAAALRALDGYPVSYRTTATDTIIEADSAAQLFAAVQAAHEAIPDDRVLTSLEVDEDRRRPQRMGERVARVEQALGHPAQRSRQPVAQQPTAPGQPTQPQPANHPQPASPPMSTGASPQPRQGSPRQQPQPPSPR